MHALGIALDKCRRVVHHLLQAFETDDLKGVTGAYGCWEIACSGFDRRVQRAVDEFVTAFSFALEGKPSPEAPGSVRARHRRAQQRFLASAQARSRTAGGNGRQYR